MNKNEQDLFFRAVFDVISALEYADTNDLAYQLVCEKPDLAEKLYFSLGFNLSERDLNATN